MTSATRAPARPHPAAPRATALPRSPLAAILSDRPQTIADAARAAGMATACADGETFWLLPYDAPRVVFVDLPVTGLSERRLALLLRQLCRACPDLVIAVCNPSGQHTALPCDIAVEDRSDDGLTDCFHEARHLMQTVPKRRSPFSPAAQKRRSLFR